MTYIIVISKRGDELTLSRQIESIGFTAYVPMQVRYHRITPGAPASKHRRERKWETPVLPGVVFAAVPGAAHGRLQSLRGYSHIYRLSPLDGPAIVTDEQLAYFRDTVDAENRRLERQFARKQTGKKASVKFKLGDLAAVPVLNKLLFGIEDETQQEKAA